MSKMIEEINVNDIFSENYIIPIYQRKYAWTDKEIEQLLEDIVNISENKKYYLGTLIVNENNGKYEVIDGQQRLITLYLLMLCLGEKYQPQCQLWFEARKNYDKALCMLKQEKLCNIDELDNCCNVIKDFLNRKCENDKTNENIIKDRLNDVIIVRVQVPENTDLNHYFEIMNTRGEQLELHHIAKARFIEKMDNYEDKKIAAAIWEACADMNSYVQKNFKKHIRDKLFLNDLSDFSPELEKMPENINNAWEKLAIKFGNINDTIGTTTLKNIINENKNDNTDNDEEQKEDEINYKYASIVTFPYFLLYVNAVLSDKTVNLYDDKKLLINLEEHLLDDESAKRFIYNMLWCRFLFDKYIVKRDMQDIDNNLELVLKQYKNYDKSADFVDTSLYKDENNGYTQNRLIILQSILRITYTSPSNMQWITELLKYTIYEKEISLNNITNLLEDYCIGRIKKHYGIEETAKIEDFSEKKYNDIERIVFTYLDYILWRDGYKENDKEIIEKHFEWQVKSRSSIEHFFAQSLVKDGDGWKEMVDCFGNLALVSVSDNSKLSNLNPKAKAAEYEIKDIINHNPKLKIMASYTKNGGEWTPEKAEEHQKEMFEILAKEINGKK